MNWKLILAALALAVFVIAAIGPVREATSSKVSLTDAGLALLTAALFVP